LILYPKRYKLQQKIADEMNLINFIKQRRKKLGLTQQELAEKAGVGLRFIRDLEQGKDSLRMDKVNDVLRLFGHKLGPVKEEIQDDSNE
jgi:y4mF family transcriptional regulator